ncbi:HhH-GPD family protein [Calditerrivibrio nitroreducens DSM 19672]|uniref:HhH-GPD family protein n=2 Tax=Calditerrivibrio nitroreducens TaxID=477976 RepID=E4TGU3_CALNY|nr:HhH-GPD family protein [Calditerrivibrio nitroreducens DSM 19672]
MAIYRYLFNRYGDLKWWPAESAFEVAIGAILTQNTSWRNVERSIENLKKFELLSPEKILGLDFSELANLIRPSGFYNQKAERLIIFSRFILEECNGDIKYLNKLETADARKRLLLLKGVGPETADSILLYACDHTIFVIDKYTMRMFNRVGMGWSEKYDIFQKNIMELLPHDLNIYRHYHALIVENSKNYCRSKPFCEGCPIAKICKKIYIK